MRTGMILGILALAAAPLAAEADGFGYTFAEGDYYNINDPSGSGLSSDHAYGVAGSYALPQNFTLIGSYAHETADTNLAGFNVSANDYSIGAGYHLPLNQTWDFYPTLSYLSQKVTVDSPFGSASQTFNGYDVALQFRGMLAEKVELNPGYDFSKVNGGGTSLTTNTLFVRAFYNFTPNIAAGLGYENASNGGTSTNTWKAVFRYYFR